MFIQVDALKKKRELKQQGLVEIDLRDLKKIKLDETKEKYLRRERARNIADKMHKDNVLQALPSFLKDFKIIKDRR